LFVAFRNSLHTQSHPSLMQDPWFCERQLRHKYLLFSCFLDICYTVIFDGGAESWRRRLGWLGAPPLFRDHPNSVFSASPYRKDLRTFCAMIYLNQQLILWKSSARPNEADLDSRAIKRARFHCPSGVSTGSTTSSRAGGFRTNRTLQIRPICSGSIVGVCSTTYHVSKPGPRTQDWKNGAAIRHAIDQKMVQPWICRILKWNPKSESRGARVEQKWWGETPRNHSQS